MSGREEALYVMDTIAQLRAENERLTVALDRERTLCAKMTMEGVTLRLGDSSEQWSRGWSRADFIHEIEVLRTACEEEARLNGMGAERELALMAKVERLQKAIKSLIWCHKHEDSGEYQNIVYNALENLKHHFPELA